MVRPKRVSLPNTTTVSNNGDTNAPRGCRAMCRANHDYCVFVFASVLACVVATVFAACQKNVV